MLEKRLKFEIETRGNEIITSTLRVYKNNENEWEEVFPEGRSFRIVDIFDYLKIDDNIFIECKYDTDMDIDIYVCTPSQDVFVASIKSRRGQNLFPKNPNKEDIAALKSAVNEINKKVKEVKEEIKRVHLKETFFIEG